eukprot:76661_1
MSIVYLSCLIMSKYFFPIKMTRCMSLSHVLALVLGMAVGYIFMFVLTEPIYTYLPSLPMQSADEHTKIEEFLSYIDSAQSNCSNSRLLIMELFGDGLGEMHHFLGQALLIAVATNRRLHIKPLHMHRNKHNSIVNQWYSIYEPLSHCTMDFTVLSDLDHRIIGNVYKYYVINTDNIVYFNNDTWAQMSTLTRYLWQNGIYNTKWFEQYGNIFIRSFVQYYIWMHINKETHHIIHQNRTLQLMHSSMNEQNTKFVGIYAEQHHDEYTHILQDIKHNDDKVVPIFINKEEVAKQVMDEMVAIEILRLSDYTIGHVRDSLFRLGMELQYATHWIRYGYCSEQIAYSMDIPWTQDP